MACKIITFGPIIKLLVSNESPTISFPQTYPYLHMVSRTQMTSAQRKLSCDILSGKSRLPQRQDRKLSPKSDRLDRNG